MLLDDPGTSMATGAVIVVVLALRVCYSRAATGDKHGQ
jgi:hypothetical protein